MSVAGLKQNGVALAGFAFAATLLIAMCFTYLRLGAYLDHIEGGVVVSGWEYAARGTPLYQLQDGAPRFATYYGPLAYLVEGLTVFGAGMAVSKLASMTAVAVTLVIMAKHFADRRGWGAATDGLFYLAAGMVLFIPQSFWVRPDPFETLLVAAGVALAASPIAVGVCIGLAVNFKIHAFVYFFPILIDIMTTRQWRSLVMVATSAILVFFIPFLMPGIYFRDYFAGLSGQIGGRAPDARAIVPVLLIALLLVLPVLCPLTSGHHPARDRMYALAGFAALLFLFYPASIPGAGTYHFLPLVPILADARTRLRPRGVIARATVLPLLLPGLMAANMIAGVLGEHHEWGSIATDALALAKQSPTPSVQIGYGDSRKSYDIAELSRAVLTLGGYPAQIDAQILMELSPIGIDGSQRWIASLTHCDTKRWLLPKGEKPFALTNFLYGLGPIFDADFRRAFLEHYRLTASDRYFDVWDCTATGKTVSGLN